jgi:hypothetical protein
VHFGMRQAGQDRTGNGWISFMGCDIFVLAYSSSIRGASWSSRMDELGEATIELAVHDTAPSVCPSAQQLHRFHACAAKGRGEANGSYVRD